MGSFLPGLSRYAHIFRILLCSSSVLPTSSLGLQGLRFHQFNLWPNLYFYLKLDLDLFEIFVLSANFIFLLAISANSLSFLNLRPINPSSHVYWVWPRHRFSLEFILGIAQRMYSRLVRVVGKELS